MGQVEKFAEEIFKKGESLPALIGEKREMGLKISLIAPYQRHLGKFFYEMLTRWLIPGKELEMASFFSARHEKGYSVMEGILTFNSQEEQVVGEKNLPFLEKEIFLGAKSPYHARKILEMKGLNIDEKRAQIQEKMAFFIRRFPKKFDYDLYEQMQHFLIVSKEVLKKERPPTILSRIIVTLYSFRKALEKKKREKEEKRFVLLKVRKGEESTPFGAREMIQVFGGFNFLNGSELFEEKHLLTAVSHLVKKVTSLPGSFYSLQSEEGVYLFYLEIEKETPFSQREFENLKRGLSAEIANRIEQRVSPIFMPRNEEEVMRTILALSGQLKYTRDIPQMHVTFNEQTDKGLVFTVTLVRLRHPNSQPLEEIFKGSHSLFDRVKIVGKVRKKIPKEAAVIRFFLPSEPFMREDHSVDLFEARFAVVKELQRCLGEVRDYNGGMISKQGENFSKLKKKLGKIGGKYSLLLQNFFHKISPPHLSATVDPQLLKILFSLLLEGVEKEGGYFKIQQASDFLFVMGKFENTSQREETIKAFPFASHELLTFQMDHLGSFYFGALYLNPDQEKQAAIKASLLDFCEKSAILIS